MIRAKREPRCGGALHGALIVIACLGCGKPELPKAPTPEVLTAAATREDVPVFAEWVGTTAGFVNA